MREKYNFLSDNNILEIPVTTNYWLVRANGGKYFDDFEINKFIAISDNKIKLADIQSYYHLADDLGATSEVYKELYNNAYPEYSSQQISISAKRTLQFIEMIKTDDIVLVPNKNSTKFLIGIVSSDAYEDNDILGNQAKGFQYTPCPYKKRRTVKWIKVISRQHVSYEMRWILSAQQTIFNLNEHADRIDKLLSPIYVKGNKCYATIHVGTENPINLDQWLTLYGLIKSASGDNSNNIILKNSIRSPGLLEIVSEIQYFKHVLVAFLVVCGTTSGMKIGKFEFQGIIGYFFNEGKIERERKKLENENLELQNDLLKAELEKVKNNSDEKVDSSSEISKDLKTNPYQVGKIIPLRKKKDFDE